MTAHRRDGDDDVDADGEDVEGRNAGYASDGLSLASSARTQKEVRPQG